MRSWAGGVLCLGLVGCTDSADLGIPPTELVYESPVLRIHAEDGRVPCGGTAQSMERALGFFEREFGLGAVEETIDVYWLTQASLAETRTSCGRVDGARGCLLGDRTVLVSYLPTEHELVHAYFAQRSPGRVHSFFEEGIAVVYGRDPAMQRPETDIRAALQQGEQLEGQHYPRAGHFMSHLLDEYGPELVGRFLASLAGIRDLAGVEPVFAEHFGVSLDAFVEQYETEAPQCTSAGWNRTVECEEVDPVPWSEPWRWEYDTSLDCDAEGVVQWYDDRIRARAALDVGDWPTHTLFLDVPEGGEAYRGGYQVELRSCGGCEEELSLTIDGDVRSLSQIVLEPGRYTVDISRDPGAPPEVGVRLQTP